MGRDIVIERDGETCIYCGNASASSTRVAHVYPCCICDNDMTLPLGVECDHCNEFAGTLERELLNHNRIGGPLALMGTPGRGGRSRKQIGNIQRNKREGTIRFLGVGKFTALEGSAAHIQLPDIGPLDDGRFRRALHHIGLNYLAYEAGATLARDPRFDDVRRYVRYGQGARSWPYAQVQHPDALIRSELGCRRFRAEAFEVIQIRSVVDDFYVCLEAGDFLRTWAQRTLPRIVTIQ